MSRWVATGQKGVKAAVISRDVIASASKMQYTSEFFKSIAPLSQCVAMLFLVVDSSMYRSYRNAYEKALITTPPLQVLTYTKRACFQGLAVVHNLAVEPHKDNSDCKNGWVAMCCWGEFEGGELVLPTLKLALKFQPGDVVFFRSALLYHYLMPFVGHRTSFVFFTHQDVVEA